METIRLKARKYFSLSFGRSKVGLNLVVKSPGRLPDFPLTEKLLSVISLFIYILKRKIFLDYFLVLRFIDTFVL